jgi:hypothetical protein
MNQFLITAAAEKLSARETVAYLRHRAERANLKDFDSLLGHRFTAKITTLRAYVGAFVRMLSSLPRSGPSFSRTSLRAYVGAFVRMRSSLPQPPPPPRSHERAYGLTPRISSARGCGFSRTSARTRRSGRQEDPDSREESSPHAAMSSNPPPALPAPGS